MFANLHLGYWTCEIHSLGVRFVVLTQADQIRHGLDPSLAEQQAFLTRLTSKRKEEAVKFELTYSQVTVSCHYKKHTLKKCITGLYVKATFSQIRRNIMLFF